MMGFECGKLFISNIQRFCLHDGPGIRTTVFLKGCSLHCPWCCNPECISSEKQSYKKDGNSFQWGELKDFSYIKKEILKDKIFYNGILEKDQWNIKNPELIDDLPGGVTFSGGEALLYAPDLVKFLGELKEENIHVTMETSLFAPYDYLFEIIDYVDLFYVDLKIIDHDQCKDLLGGDTFIFRRNFDFLIQNKKPVIIRVPVISGFTDSETNRFSICKMLDYYKKELLKIELLCGHHLGDEKYHLLNLPIPNFGETSNELLCKYKDELSGLDIPVEICTF